MRQQNIIVVVVVIFMICGLMYDSATPLFEGLDEVWHYAMVKRLADGESLPVVEPGVDTAWRQEGLQPPLYYAILSAATNWVDTSDYASHRMLTSTNLTIGLPHDEEGEKFWYYHTRSEDFPYRNTALAVHIGRWISMIMAAGTVVLSYGLARELFPRWNHVATLTAAIVAFNPGFLFVSNQVNNDNLTNLLGAAAAMLMARLWKRGFSPYLSIWMALLCSMLALTKLNGISIILALAILTCWYAAKHHMWKQYLHLVLICGAAIALISGWWYARNVVLYGSPFPMEIHRSFVTTRSLTFLEVLKQYWGYHVSYWGVFGLSNVLLPTPAYQIYAFFSWVALAGVGIWTWRHRRTAHRTLPIPVVLVAIMLLSTLYWTRTAPGPAGRLSYPAIGAISLLAAIGILSIVPRGWQGYSSALLASIMAIVALVVPFMSIRPSYELAMLRPPLASDGITMQYPLEAYLGDVIKLAGFDVTRTSEYDMLVTMHWVVLSRTDEHLIVFVHLLDSDGILVTGHDGVPLDSMYPSEVWSPGEWLADTHSLRVSEGFEQGEYQLVVGMYRFVDQQRLRAKDSEGRKVLHDVIPLLPRITLSD